MLYGSNTLGGGNYGSYFGELIKLVSIFDTLQNTEQLTIRDPNEMKVVILESILSVNEQIIMDSFRISPGIKPCIGIKKIGL